MSRYAKVTTNLAKLAVAKNPAETLTVLYSKCLRTLAKMPSDYPYRKHTEQIVMERADLVKKTHDIAELEAKIDCGQIEEVIIQADNELQLARSILEWRSWEPLVNDAPKDQWKWPL